MAGQPVVFVFGVSGATWSVIDPLIAAGQLPNLSRLVREGCRGDLRSLRAEGDEHYRPQVAWASIATGCRPESHGITRYFHTAEDLKRPAIWSRLASAGRTVGIYGWPLDWPPPALDGFVVPSHWARDTRTWPPSLSTIKELDRLQQSEEREGRRTATLADRLGLAFRVLRLGARPATLASIAGILAGGLAARDPERKTLALRHAKLALGVDFFLALNRRFRPSFSSFHTFLVDFASHRYWRYHQPELFPSAPGDAAARFGDAVEDAYRRVDAALGRIVASLPDGAVIAFLSEHGMSAEPRSSELGEWRYVIRGETVLRLLGLGGDHIARPVARWVAVSRKDGAPLAGEIAEHLRSVTVETGRPLFQVIQNGAAEIVIKLNLQPDVPRYAQGDLASLSVTCAGQSLPFEAFCRRLGRTRSAMHDGQAVFVIRGPGVRRGERLGEISLIDVAPTLLRACGLAPPSDMDGAPLDVFDAVPHAPEERQAGATAHA